MASKNSKIQLKDRLIFIGGLALGLFSVVALLSSLSFMVNWKQDQSLRDIQSFFDEGLRVANQGGALGHGIGHFLVAECFGVAALIFCAVLCVLAVRIVLARDINPLKAVLWGLGVTFTTSLALAFAGSLIGFGLDTAFGHGIGGAASAYLVMAMQTLMGPIVTALVIVFLGVVLAYLLTDGFAGSADRETDSADEATDELTTFFNDAVDTEPVIEPLPPVDELVPDFDEMTQEEGPSSGGGLTLGGQMDLTPEGQTLPAQPDLDVVINGPEDEISTDIQEELPQLDIRSEINRYKFPSLDLLEDYADKRFTIPKEEIERNVNNIRNTLASFKIRVDSITASVGYTVTLYKITLGDGVKVNQVKNLEEDIAIKIGIKGVRVVKLADAVGIEVPNDRPSVVPLKAILNSDAFRNARAELPIALGYTITTKAKVFDLADAPHLLVAGATKQGKSVGLNAIIASLLYSKHPSELKFVFIDPKMVEFQQYSKLYNHYLAVMPSAEGDQDEAENAIVKDAKNAELILRSLCEEMDERYKLLAAAKVNKITDYNEKFRNRHLNPQNGHHFIPYLVVVIDEYADLTKSTFGSDKNLSRSIENSIIRLAAKGRAAGLHVIIATQRPSVDVITGTIKSNFPTRLAFRTASRQDSQTILGMPGADKLIGRGDMLYFSGVDPERVQCALISTDEIDALTESIAVQTGFKQKCTTPYYLPIPEDEEGGEGAGSGAMVDMKNLDPLFEEAAKLAVFNRNLSTTMIQRKLQLGFARAGRLMDQLESAGIVGPAQGSRPREALVQDMASLQPILDAFLKR